MAVEVEQVEDHVDDGVGLAEAAHERLRGEMHAPLQSKLLQVLQDGEFARLGSRNDVRVDVRIVATRGLKGEEPKR